MDYKRIIADLLKKEVTVDESIIEVPPDPKLGDFALPCFPFAKVLKKNPVQIASELAAKIKPNQHIRQIKATGPYLNFFVNKSALAEEVLGEIAKQKDKYGSSDIGKGRTVIVEFSSPNIAKPLGIHHLRSTVIGNSLYKIHKFLGYKVERINHIGDWGTQFGQLIVAHKKWGDEKKLKEDPIKYMLDIYVKFNQEAEKHEGLHDDARSWFKRLEDGNAEAKKIWKMFSDLSIKEYKRVYKLLDVDFDSYAGEAFYSDKMEDSFKKLKQHKLAVESKGAIIVELDKYNMPPCILKKSDDATTYALRDIAAAEYRMKTYRPEKIVYVVASQQNLHFEQLFKVLGLMGYDKDMFVHVNFGFMSLPEGGMSTRKGRIIFMEDVLDRAVELAAETIEKKNPDLKEKKDVARKVGIGAVIFADLRNDRIKDVTFDWNQVLDFEGDTAPYLQYTYARAGSILKKAAEQKIKLGTDAEFSKLKEEDELSLITALSNFKQAIQDAMHQYKPHIISQYLLQLARTFNEFYHKTPVLNAEDEDLRDARLLLVSAARQVIKNGLNLLGIESPERM